MPLLISLYVCRATFEWTNISRATFVLCHCALFFCVTFWLCHLCCAILELMNIATFWWINITYAMFVLRRSPLSFCAVAWWCGAPSMASMASMVGWYGVWCTILTMLLCYTCKDKGGIIGRWIGTSELVWRCIASRYIRPRTNESRTNDTCMTIKASFYYGYPRCPFACWPLRSVDLVTLQRWDKY